MNLALFILVLLILIVIAMLAIIPPLLGKTKRHKAQAQRQVQAEASLVILREQLQELKQDYQEGKIEEPLFYQEQNELEQRVLEEVDRIDTLSCDTRSSPWLAASLALGVPILALIIYLCLGQPLSLIAPSNIPHKDQVTAEDIYTMIPKLIEHLQRQPDDIKVWKMLPRAYYYAGHYEDIPETWHKLAPLVPKNADVLADWAQILAMSQQGVFTGLPESLLKQALAIDANHVPSLTLLARMAQEQGDKQLALKRYQKILTILPPSDQQYQQYQQLADTLQQELASEQAKIQNKQASNRPKSQAKGILAKVKVALSQKSVDKVYAEQKVFIYVLEKKDQAPLAAVMLKVSDLPATIDFSKVPLMLNKAIPAHYFIVARLSASGTVKPNPRDIETQIGPLDNRTKTYELWIKE